MRKLIFIIPLIYLLSPELFAQNGQVVKDDPKGAWEFELMRTADPETGKIPYEKFEEARETARQQILDQRASGAENFGNWSERGPNNFGGRTRAIMWDPIIPNKVWAGGVNGGLWVNNDITDENSEWQLQTSFDGNFAISSIVYDHDDPDTLYIGTGEYWAIHDYNTGVNGSIGNGVYQSTDKGLNWMPIGNDNGSFYYVNKMIVRNNQLYVCTETGLYIYSNSWIKLLDGIFSDIEILAGDFIVAQVDTKTQSYSGRIYKIDDQNNIEEINNSLQVQIAKRNELTVNENTGVIITTTTNEVKVHYIERSILNGSIYLWEEIGAIPFYSDPQNNCILTDDDFTRTQAFYNITIAFCPSTNTTLVLGGINLYLSDNLGDSWDKISDEAYDNRCGPQYVHPDQHSITFNPLNPSQALFTNDGGVYYCANIFGLPFPVIEPRNNGFNVAQFYSCFPDQNSDYILGGTQDNGSISLSSQSNKNGEPILYGDGGFCYIDSDNSDIKIISSIRSDFRRSLGNDFNELNILKNKGMFINPSDYDSNLNILYLYYGTPRQTGEIGDSIMRIKGMGFWFIDKDVLRFNISHGIKQVDFLKLSPSGLNLYASVIDNSEAVRIYKITNANSNNYSTEEIPSGDLPDDGHIGCIAFGENENNIVVTYTNYSSNELNIFYTTNGGDPWEVKQGNLDNIPIRWAEFNPNDYKQVLIATEVGLWKTDDITQSSPQWDIIQIDQGADPSLSLVRCDMIRVRPSDNKVFVATHGRGIWESDIFMNYTPVPNLKITNAYPLPPSATMGEELNVELTIQNDGQVQAGYSTTKGYLSNDNVWDNNDLELFEKYTPAIAAGSNIILQDCEFTIPGSLGSGSKYLLFKADANDDVYEGSHENDNVFDHLIYIIEAPPGSGGPDLTVLNEFVSKKVIAQNQSFSVNCDVLNQGDENATGGWKQRWYLSTDQNVSGDDIILDYLDWAFLPFGQSNYIHREMTMPAMAPDGEYYIIIYIDADEEVAETNEFNNIRILSITVGTIPVPELHSPFDGEEEVSLNPTFYWEDFGNDIDSYEFAIYDYVGGYLQQVYFKSGLTEPEWKVTNFNFGYDEGYKWTARCRVDGTHGAWATVNDFRTRHYLSRPVLYDPNNYLTNEPLTPTFTWSSDPQADYYKIALAYDEEFEEEIEDWSILTNNWFNLPAGYLDTATTYFWRVKAYAGAGDSDYSDVFRFRTGGDIVPGIPENVSPGHESVEISLNPQLVWITGNGVSLSFQVDISSDSLFSTIVFTQDNIETEYYFVPPGNLTGLTKYYWRVRGWNGAGFGPWSESTTFHTTSEGGPGTIKWFRDYGGIEGTPVFDRCGYMWFVIDGAVAKVNPVTGDTLFTLDRYARQTFSEGVTISHTGDTVYTIVDDDIFNTPLTYNIAALDLEGNVLWHYDTHCRKVSKPVLDAQGNIYVTLSDGYPPYYNESSVLSLDPAGNFRWRNLVFSDTCEFLTWPVVKGSRVFVGREEIDDVGAVFALNTSNGSTSWQKNFTDSRMDGEIPGLSDDGFVFGNQGSLEYLNKIYQNSGNNIPGWPFTSAIDGFNGATVIDEFGNIFNGIDEEFGESYAYGFSPDGTVLWQKQITYDFRDSQVIDDNGILYFGSKINNILFAVDKDTGDELWTLNLGRTFDDLIVGPDGTLFVDISNPDGLMAIETGSTGLNQGQWPVKVHDYQGTNCYDHVSLTYPPTLLEFSIKNGQDTTRTIENPFNYQYLNIATHFKISEDSFFTNCDWIPIDSSYIFPISTGYGVKTAFFVMKNDQIISDTLMDDINYISSEPLAITNQVSNLNLSNAVLHGRVMANNLNTFYYMEYGVTASYGYHSDTSFVFAGHDTIPVDIYVDGLLPNTQYFYRLSAENSGGTNVGEGKSFTTLDLLPPVNLNNVVSGYDATITWAPPDLECFSCEVLGYNIYRDTMQINTELIFEPSYQDVGLVNGLYDYTVTAIYQEGESVLSDTTNVEIAGGGFPVEWDHYRTQNPHVVVIPLESTPMIGDRALSRGDYIGVFYLRGNDEVCGGAARWDGIKAIALIAYGDDSLSVIKDGFYPGEEMLWKMKSWDMDVIVSADPVYDTTYPHFDGKLHEFGLSGLTSLNSHDIVLDLKVFIEGPFNNGSMSNSLNQGGFIPLAQPYNGPPWYYPGNEMVNGIPDTNVVDWILIELRETPGDASSASGATTIAKSVGFLLSNGTIRDINGSGMLSVSHTVTQNLYAVIWHRNHIGIMSAWPLSQSVGVYSYDFSGSVNQIFGGNLTAKELMPGIWGMVGGDGNSDTQVNNADKLDVWRPQAGSSGYLNADFNLNTQVNNQDKNDIWAPNSGSGGQVPDYAGASAGKPDISGGALPDGMIYKCFVPE